MAATRRTHPFAINAFVVLPDHLHAIWTLPPDDSDFSVRWRLIKTRFAKALPANERLTPSVPHGTNPASSNAGFGSISSAMKPITRATLSIAITTRSSTGTFPGCVIGRIRRSIATCALDCFRRIGAGIPRLSASSENAVDLALVDYAFG